MVTYDQIQGAKLADVQNNPELLSVIARLYGGEPSRMLSYWNSGYRSFDSDKNYANQNLYNSYLRIPERDLEKYGNWNNSNNKSDQASAFKERESGLAALNQSSQWLKDMGLDPSTIPQMKQMADQFGPTPGAGLTSDKTAKMQWDDKAGWTDKPVVAPPAGVNKGTPEMATQGQIPFKSTMSPDQRKTIEDMVAKRPDSSTWNDTDKANWNYATGNAPLPTSQTPPGGTPSDGGSNAGDGTSDSAGGSGGAGGGTADPNHKTPDQEREELKSMGINVDGMSDDQLAQMYAMKQMFDLRVNQDKEALPKQFTSEEMLKFMQDAQSELAPYYAERLRIGSTDILNAVSDITQDYAFKEKVRLQTNQAEQQKKATEMADAGLAFSGIRSQAEAQMKENQSGIVRSEASDLSRSLRDKANEYEKMYGSAALSNLKIPGLTYAGVQVAPPQAYGGLMGTEAKDQKVSEEERQAALAKAEMEKRFGLGMSVEPKF